MRVREWMLAAAAALLAIGTGPAMAQQQMTTIDPDTVIDSDLGGQPPAQRPAPRQDGMIEPDYSTAPAPTYSTEQPQANGVIETPTDVRDQARQTFQRDDLIGAAEGVFGSGAADLAKLIENILRDQGEPNAYIAGREAAGAFIVGLRYGSGQMFHKIEGERPVYWTGPSIGFDVGGDADKVFVLVYNLYDTQDIYKRFPQGEGRAYLIGGFSAGYLRRGDVVLIPVRLGVGWRVGINAGYMKFSEKKRWLPF